MLHDILMINSNEELKRCKFIISVIGNILIYSGATWLKLQQKQCFIRFSTEEKLIIII